MKRNKIYDDWYVEDKIIELKNDLMLCVENELLRKRFNFIQDALKNQREDIETLFKYNKYVTIYATIINLVLVGLMICLILTN